MTRQSISLAAQIDEWLKQQVDNEEFTSKSEPINYLIQRARKHKEYYEMVRMEIALGEKSGMAKRQTREDMLTEFKKKLNV